jgi:hypothetical protein
MMKQCFNVAEFTVVILGLTLTLAGCPQPNEDDPFVPVTNISGVPVRQAWELLLP